MNFSFTSIDLVYEYDFKRYIPPPFRKPKELGSNGSQQNHFSYYITMISKITLSTFFCDSPNFIKSVFSNFMNFITCITDNFEIIVGVH